VARIRRAGGGGEAADLGILKISSFEDAQTTAKQSYLVISSPSRSTTGLATLMRLAVANSRMLAAENKIEIDEQD
jgi:hypothetical protein